MYPETSRTAQCRRHCHHTIGRGVTRRTSTQVVSQRSIRRDWQPEVDRALAKILQHLRLEHPGIRPARSWRLLISNEQAVPCFLWVEKYKRLSADEESSDREQTPACDASWAPIDATSCWERSPTRCCSIWAATACARADC